MFHKVKAVRALPDFKLSVQFAEGITKIYDVTPFDGLMAFTDATQLWGLNESTLRKAISYGKLIDGVDACKYGKQWVISIEAMKREYGPPKKTI